MSESGLLHGMRRQIVQELYGFGHCFLQPLRLFACNRTEGHEYREVNCTGVVLDTPDDLVDVFYVSVAEGW